MTKGSIMKVKMGATELVELGRKCRGNQVLRRSFVRSDGTRVRAACVPDKGAPGKTPASNKWADFGSNYLPGWHKTRSTSERHSALASQTRKEGCVTVIRKLTQLRNVTTDGATKNKAKADARWLHDQNFCHLKTKGR